MDKPVRIESDGTSGGTKVTYRGEILPVESVTWTADARGVVRAVLTIPSVLLDSHLSPDLVEFAISHEQDPKPEG